jgi:ATP-dependent RNA helicase DDX21
MVLKGFRDGRYKCLIATDVAARGLDIPEVDLVIQCCPPKDVESYIHRSGRTGRAGRDGTCVLFYKPNEEHELGYVEQRAGIQFKRIGPPSARDVIKACAQDAVRTLDTVKPAALECFRQLADQLTKERNVVDVLAAALAIISGNAELKQRSLLSSREGFTTFLFQTNVEMKQLGYAWRSLERC